ncbi:stage V sporulation protein SpoVM [Salipaludibacillus neizhouensis]|uniref:Stage V sporulation protein SpoVM n=1 Tax=Salipaludibacillus neizhouensis TaxID=885475 RepID=A0A3A9KEG5_9BACI|nr:stage V sporulation protein SpoVM [Salipaludibacillus neizhouensis]
MNGCFLKHKGLLIRECPFEEGKVLKFYTIKLPRFIGGFVRAVLGTFKKS